MKKHLIALALVVATGLSATTAATPVTVKFETKVLVAAAPPAAVLKAFTTIFGSVAVSEWKLRSNGQWRAHFVKNGVQWQATFSAAGALVKSEPA